jgi:regulator of replication initiation timing
MELLKIDNGEVTLVEDAVRTIVTIENTLKDLKKKQDEYKTLLLEAMEANGSLGFENDELKITYVAPYDKEVFDGKALKNDNPELYDSYVKMSTTKSSLRITVK